jgi:hypothetical protein
MANSISLWADELLPGTKIDDFLATQTAGWGLPARKHWEKVPFTSSAYLLCNNTEVRLWAEPGYKARLAISDLAAEQALQQRITGLRLHVIR